MAKPVHSMIRVLDEARSLDFYKRAFGLEVADHLKFSDFALVVDDLDTEPARFEREKLAPGPLRDFKHDGKTLARFFFVSDPDGYKIEVIQRGGRFG
jgi:lactoylglutathione lyase